MNRHTPRILIFGAGVIGSAFAVKLIRSGCDITFLARGNRLQQLRDKGLLFDEKGETRHLPVKVIEQVEPDDIYDFILVPVPCDQVATALTALRDNQSATIVTFSNAVDYGRWTAIVGDRLVPGFPGAGGEIRDGILHATFISRRLGGTAFGEVDGSVTPRIEKLRTIFEAAGIACQVPKRISDFHISHASMIIPALNFYRETGMVDLDTARSPETLRKVAADVRLYTGLVKRAGIPFADIKAWGFAMMPSWLVVLTYKMMLDNRFTRGVLLGSHAARSRHEITLLREDFQALMKKKGLGTELS